jgi:nicotinamide-nucleotide amidase
MPNVAGPEEALEALVATLATTLKQQGIKLVTAESCTGGGVAQAVTRLPGSSDWFDRGLVTYSNQSKHEMLGVSSRTLETAGAVSEATVREMAEGALRHSRAQVSVAVSGIAGPGGASPGKPVGTVCLAWASLQQSPSSTTLHFPGDRTEVRRRAVIAAIQGLLDFLGKKNSG